MKDYQETFTSEKRRGCATSSNFSPLLPERKMEYPKAVVLRVVLPPNLSNEAEAETP
jgi:hypothetical protein